MRKLKTTHTVDVVFVLVLFCTFTAAILMVLLTGAGAYKGIVTTMEQHYEERIALSYVEAKVHHYDQDNAISVASYAGQPALRLQESSNERSYSTWIYYYDGAVRELFCEDSVQLSPEVGQVIITAQAFTPKQVTPQLLQVQCTGASGNQAELFLNIRSRLIEGSGQ